MVDFNKKVRNSSKFRLSAIFFLEHGCYTLAPKGTTDYNRFWDQETERCLNGYVAEDGDAITGYHYFYLNYSPIMKLKEVLYTDRYGNLRTRRERVFDFPSYWDLDYYYFNAIEQAEDEGKHMVVLKSRQRGFSFKGASMLVRNYELIPGSKNFAVASEQKYLVGDGLLTKAWLIMDFVDKHTDWSKQRLTSTRMERVSGFKVTDEYGKLTEQGYLSSITGITLKNDPERLRGTRGKLVLFEEGGKFPNLETAWRVELPAVETDDGRAFGLLVAFGTGGTEGASFDGLKTMFYHPDAFNILSFPNIWDDNAENTKCGFFAPSYLGMEGEDENGNALMDEDGNSLKELAIEELIRQRNKVKDGGASLTSIDRFISERPIKPQEAVLELGKNIFPRKLLMDLLTRIRTNTKLRNMKHIVDLSWDGNGKVQATEKKSGDITTYHLKKDDKPSGSVVIWEYPIPDAPFGLYIAGCLTPGEKVITQRGLVNVEDVTLDDYLINKDGQFVEIRNLQRYQKENENVYKVKTVNTYRTTTFTGEHPIYSTKKENLKLQNSFSFRKMKDIQVGDYIKFPNVYYNTNEFIETPVIAKDFWWFVGLWLGDGWCEKDRHKVYIVFDKTQTGYIEKYERFLTEQLHKPFYKRTRGGTVEISFCYKKLNNWLTETFGKMAYGKRIPDKVKRICKEDKIRLLMGYMDSDGCVYYNERQSQLSLEYVSINLELLEDIQDLCFGVGIVSGITKLRDAKTTTIQGRVVQQRAAYHLRLTKTQTKKMCLMMQLLCDYDNIKLNKSNVVSDYKESYNPRCFLSDDNTTIISQITEILISKYTGIVYNFECDTHTYMCRNILTHNCDPYAQVSGSKTGQKRWTSRTDNTVLILLIAKGSRTV